MRNHHRQSTGWKRRAAIAWFFSLAACCPFARAMPDLQDCDEFVRPAAAKSAAEPALVAASEDIGNVTVMEVGGSYDRGMDEPRRQVATQFFANHPDQYDFLIAFTTFEFETQGALAFYNHIRNDTAGIGRTMFDYSNDFGSAGRLQGYVDMAAMGRYSFASGSPQYHEVVDTLAHEVMHRWGAAVRFMDAGGSESADLIGNAGSHWSYYLDSDGSVMYGNDWQIQPDGSFRSVDVRHRYSPLDLYLAGWAAASEVPPFTLIRNGSGASATDLPRLGATTDGSAEAVTIEQIVAANGPRAPSAASAQRDFNAALILLKRPGESVPAERLLELERFRIRFQQQLAEMTDGRAAVHMFTQQRGAGTALPAILQGSGATSTPGGVAAALAWLEAHQAQDGHWQDRAATAMRDTVAALRALEELDPAYPGLSRARAWISEHAPANVDQRAWKLMGSDGNFDAEDLVRAQDAQGGFAIEEGWVADNVDTGMVALALANQGQEPLAVAAALQHLGMRQNVDGSVGIGSGTVGRMRPTLSAASLWARQGDDGSTQRLAAASQWIGARLLSPQPALVDTVDAYALVGRLPLAPSASATARQYVRSQQQIDGDWGGSIYLTATAALAYARDQRPNLALSGVPTLSPSQPYDGEHAILRAGITNSGNVPVDATVLRWFDGDPDSGGAQIGGDVAVPGLAAGSSTTISTDWDTRNLAGVHELWVILDATAIAIEASELDNRSHLTATVLPPSTAPDLALQRAEITLDPAVVTTLPQPVHLSGSVHNIGGEDAGEAVVRLYARPDLTHALAQTTVSVRARGTTTFALDFEVSVAATTNLVLRVDPDDAIAEASESNNDVDLALPYGPSIDLEVAPADLTLLTAQPLVGHEVEFDVIARNRGTVDTPPALLQVTVTQGGTVTTIFDTPLQVGAGQSVHRRVTWTAGEVGAAQLHAALDPLNQIAETEEGNNSAELGFDVGAVEQADLTFESGSFELAPDPALEGQPFTATLGVRNLSTVATGEFRVSLYATDPLAGGIPIASTVIPSLAGLGRMTATMVVPDLALRGDQRMFAMIDAGGQVAEIDENNNVVVRPLRVRTKPDLAITVADILLSPPLPVPGQSVQASVTVRNLGDQDAHDVTVRLLEGDGEEAVAVGADKVVGLIAGGATTTLTWNWTLGLAPSSHAVMVTADPDDHVREGSDANNTAVLPFDVQNGDFFATERYISPNGDGIRDAVDFVFNAGVPGQVEVDVVNAVNDVIRRFTGVALNSESRGQVLWDGRDQRGRVVPDGDYRFVVVGGSTQEAVLVTVDNNQSSLLGAVGTPHGVYTELPRGMLARIPPASSPLHDQVFGLWRANAQSPVGVYRSDTVYASAVPVISGAWVRAFGIANGVSVELVDFAFSQDGSDIVAVLRGNHAGHATLWVVHSPVDQTDAPVLLAEFPDVYAFNVLGYFDATSVAVGPDRSGMLDVIDVDSHVVTPLRNLQGEVGGGAFKVVPLGLLRSSFGPPDTFIPRDPAKPVIELQYGEHASDEEFDAELSPTLQSIAVHRRNSRDVIELVDLASGARRALVDEPADYVHGGFSGQSAGISHLGMGWLDSREQLVIANASTRRLSIYSPSGQRLSERTLPDLQRIGPYSPSGNEGSPVPFDSSNVVAASYPRLAGEPCARELDARVEHRILDRARNRLYLSYGEIAARDEPIEGWVLVQHPGIRAYAQMDADDGDVDVVQRGTLLPLQSVPDQAVYPLLEPCAGAPAPDWPELILRDGARIRTDGLVQTLDRGVLQEDWPSDDASVRALWGDESRALLDGDRMFTTLQNLHAVLHARTLGRGIELTGIAADRNFASYRLEWAPIEDQSASAWQALSPATSDEVLKDEFLTWVPPQPGTFVIRLVVMDKAGNSVSTLATASSFDSSAIDNFSLAPRYFSPNGDGVNDIAVAKYRVRQPVTLAIRITDATGAIVRTVDLTYGTADLGAQEFHWDGRDDAGHALPDGRYRLNADGFAAWLTLDTLPPELGGDVPPAYVRDVTHVDVRPMVRMATRDANAVHLVLESRTGDDGVWSVVAERNNASLDPSRSPTDPNNWEKRELPASNYTARRFRLSATDPAGNVRNQEIGRAEDVLVLRTVGPEYYPSFYYTPPPFDAVPDMRDWRPRSVQRDSDDDYLSAAALVAGLVRIAVETADADSPQQWAERNVYPLADEFCPGSGFCLKPLADELRVPLDLGAVPQGARLLVRLRGEREDGSRVYSNQGLVQVGGIDPPTCSLAADGTRSVRSVEYADGALVEAILHYIEGGNEHTVAASHLYDDEVFFDAPWGATAIGAAWVTGTDAAGFSYRSPDAALACSVPPDGWLIEMSPAPVVVDNCDGLPSNKISVGLRIEKLPQGVPGEPEPLHVRVSYVDGLSGSRVVLREIDGSQPLDETDVIATDGWPEGEHQARMDIDYVDGSSRSKTISLPVTRQPPSTTIVTPRSGERVCAMQESLPGDPPQQSIPVSIDLHSTLPGSYRLLLGSGASPSLFTCYLAKGESYSYSDMELCPAYSLINGFTLRSLDGGAANVKGDLTAYDGTATIQVKGLGWSGGTVCTQRTFNMDSVAEMVERASPHTILELMQASEPIVGISASGQQGSFFLRADEPVRVDATLHRAHIDPATNTLILDAQSLGTLWHQDSAFGDIDIHWDGVIEGQPAADGLYGIAIDAEDDCAHITRVVYGALVDSTPPDVGLTAPAPGTTVTSAVVGLVGSVQDNVRLASWRLEVATAESPERWQEIASGSSPVPGPEVLKNWARGSLAGPVDIRFTAIDAMGNRAETHLPLVLGDPPVLIGGAQLQPMLYSPNGDGVLDSTRLQLDLLRAAIVDVRVFDPSDHLVASLYSGPQVAGSAGYTWNGLDALGHVVADGVYAIRVDAHDGVGPGETQSLAVIVDATPPLVDVRRPTGAYASPASAVELRFEDAHFTQYEARLTRLSDGAQVASQAGAQPGDAVLTTLARFDEGRYSLHAEAQDGAGNRTSRDVQFDVDAVQPTVTLETPAEGALIPSTTATSVVGSIEDAHLASYSLAVAPEQGDAWTELSSGTASVPHGELIAWRPELPDSRYRLRLRAIDEAGNATEVVHGIEIDGTPPVAVITAPNDGGFLGSNGNVDGTATDAHFAGYRLSVVPATQAAGGQWSDIYSSTTPVDAGRLATLSLDLPENDYVLRLVATDRAGLVSTQQVRVRIDATPPPAPIGLTGRVDNNRDVILDWSAVAAADLSGYLVYRDGLRITPASVSGTHHVDVDVPEGFPRYQVRAVDAAGNESAPSNTVALLVDRTPPTAQINHPGPGERVRGIYEIVGTASSSDDFKTYRITAQATNRPAEAVAIANGTLAVQGGLLAAWNTRSPEFQQDDMVHLRLDAEDTRGNVATATADVVIDNAPPAAPTGLVASIVGADAQTHWDSNGEADLLGYLLYRDNQLVNATGPNVPADLRPFALADVAYVDAHIADGRHTYVVYAIDRAGNVSPPSSPVMLDPLDNAPPSMTIESPADGTHFEASVTVLATSRDTDITEVRYSYRAEGAGDWTELGAPLTSAPYRIIWQPASDVAHGNYEVRAVARDAGGRVDPTPPVVHLVYADMTAPPAPTSLVAHADGAVARLAWSASAAPDLAGYRIYRDGYEVGTLDAGSTAFDDAGLGDAHYTYSVVAYDSSGNTSASSNEAAVDVFGIDLEQPFSPTKLAAIDLRGCSARAGRVELHVETPQGISDAAPSETSTAGVVAFPGYALERGSNHFTMRVTDHAGNVSRPADVWVDRGSAPAVPTGVVATVDDHRVELGWTANSETDLLGYRVFRNGQPLEADRLLGELPTPASDVGDAAAAVDGNPQSSWVASVIDGDAEASDDPTIEFAWVEPRIVVGADLAWSIFTVSGNFDMQAWSGHAWIQVASMRGTRQSDQQVEFVQPYRTTRIRIVAHSTMTGTLGYQAVQLAEIHFRERPVQGATSIADTVTDGAWRYSVSALSTLAFESNSSEPVTAGAGDVQGPEPVMLSGDLDGNAANLSWTASSSVDVARYSLERDGEPIATVAADEPRMYVDTGLLLGAHEYVVRAYDAFENEGPPSNTLVLTVLGEGPGVPLGVTVTAPATGGELDIQWQPGGGVAAAEFVVRRALLAAGPFEPVADVDSTEYRDAPLTDGTTYYYTVEAVDAVGNFSGPSEPVSGTPRDRVAPEPPVLTYPTAADAPLTMRAEASDVCGEAESGAAIELERNSLGVASTVAAAAYAAGSTTSSNTIALMPAPSGARVVAIDDFGVIRIQDIDNGVASYASEPGTRLQSWVSRGEALYYVSSSGQYVRWEPGSAPEPLGVPISAPSAFSVNPRGTAYLIVGDDGQTGEHGVWLVDAVGGPRRRIDIDADSVSRVSPPNWSPDGAYVLVVDTGGTLRLVDATSGAVATVLPLGGEGATAWSDRSHFTYARMNAYGGDDLQVFDIATGADELLLTRYAPIVALASSPSGSVIAILDDFGIDLVDTVAGYTTPLDSAASYRTMLSWTASGRIFAGTSDRLDYFDLPGWFCARRVPLMATNVFVARATDPTGNRGFGSLPIEVDAPVGELPDLAVSEGDVFIVPATGTTSDSYAAVVTVHNLGSIDVEHPSLAATLISPDGRRTALAAPPLGPLAAGQTRSLTYPIGMLASAGSWRVDVAVDPDLSVRESNESNNTASAAFTVSADGAPVLDLALGRAVFAPGEAVVGDVGATGTGLPFTGRVHLDVLDSGGAIVTDLGDFAIEALGFNQHWHSAIAWDAHGILAGDYRMRSRLFDQAGLALDERSVAFSISVLRHVVIGLVPDAATQIAGRDVVVRTNVVYTDGNAIIDGALLRLVALDAGGVEQWRHEQVLGSLLPGYELSREDEWPTTGLSEGVYTLRLSLAAPGYEASVDASVTLSAAEPAVTLAGSIAFEPGTTLIAGEGALMRTRVSNSGTSALAGVQTRVRISAEPGHALVSEITDAFDLGAGESHDAVSALSAPPLALASHAAILEARLPSDPIGQWRLLARRSFAVVDGLPPSITVLAPVAASLQPAVVPFVARIVDQHSGISRAELRVDGGTWQPVSAGPDGAYSRGLAGLVDGGHTISVRARDGWGNETQTPPLPFEVDASSPVITISGVADGVSYGQAVIPDVTIEDLHLAESEIRLDGAVFVPGTAVGEDGSHVLMVRAGDSAGNRSQRVVRFTIDRSAPAVVIVAPADGAVINAPSVDVDVMTEAFAITRLGTGTYEIEQAADDEGYVHFAGVPLLVGSNRISATARDAAGNVGAPAAITVVYDPMVIGPLTGSLQPPGAQLPWGTPLGLHVDVQNPNAVAAAAQHLRVRVASGADTLAEHVFTHDFAAHETYAVDVQFDSGGWPLAVLALRLELQQGADWLLLDGRSIEVVDRTAPLVELLSPVEADVLRSPTTLRATASDELSGISEVEASLDGGVWSLLVETSPGVFESAPMALGDGDHEAMLRAHDGAGNPGERGPVHFAIDTQPPLINVAGVGDGDLLAHAVTPVITISDAHLFTSDVRLDDQPYVSGTVIAASGEHRIDVLATDSAGNAATETISFILDLDVPSVAFISPAPGAVVAVPAVDVIGETESLAQVHLSVGSFGVDTYADAEGRFSVLAVPLQVGANTILAHATDRAGNVGSDAALEVIFRQPAEAAVTGFILPFDASWPQAVPVLASYVVRNTGGLDLAALPLRFELRATAGGDVLVEDAFQIDLPVGAEIAGTRVLRTTALPSDTYSLTLQALLPAPTGPTALDTEMLTLAMTACSRGDALFADGFDGAGVIRDGQIFCDGFDPLDTVLARGNAPWLGALAWLDLPPKAMLADADADAGRDWAHAPARKGTRFVPRGMSADRGPSMIRSPSRAPRRRYEWYAFVEERHRMPQVRPAGMRALDQQKELH
ncbi:CARDB domain-containing protein [Dokdonella fugitiva]|uniref:Ig-like protein group 3 n=1 Tax=Dokdonella fugitiva TaxID=328517 RepID=A0A4R2I162_9GAMM|nr:CARDB domain-containing protein [Dokdonella fugitiva]TCO37652.1 Ig-like protein group 3 [Dokdonella fugitiva]